MSLIKKNNTFNYIPCIAQPKKFLPSHSIYSSKRTEMFAVRFCKALVDVERSEVLPKLAGENVRKKF